MTAATWQWYGAMDAALRGQHCLSRPLLMVTNVTSTADGVVSTLALAPSVEEDTKGKGKMPNGRETVLGQLGIPKCISPQPATAATMVESTERKPHNCQLHFQNITVVHVQNGLCCGLKLMMFFFFFFLGTTEETQSLIAWRAANGNLFTGRRNSSINGWE